MKFKESQFNLDYCWLKGKKKELCIYLAWEMRNVNLGKLIINDSFKIFRKKWNKRTIDSLVKDGYIQVLKTDRYYYYILPSEKYII